MMKNRSLSKRMIAGFLTAALLASSLTGCAPVDELREFLEPDHLIEFVGQMLHLEKNGEAKSSEQQDTEQASAGEIAEAVSADESSMSETQQKEAEAEETVSEERPRQESILIPERITASSELEPYPSELDPTKYFTYYASYIDDRNLDTAWNEGADNNGIGEYMELYYPAGTEIIGGLFFPGYYKTEELFFENNAITSLEISTGGTSIVLDTSEFANVYSEDYQEKEFTLEEPLICDGVVRVTILDVREGTTYNDACISELQFRGYPVNQDQENQAGDAHYNYMHGEDLNNSTDMASRIVRLLNGAYLNIQNSPILLAEFSAGDTDFRSERRFRNMLREGGAYVEYAVDVHDPDQPAELSDDNARYYVDVDQDGTYDYTLYLDFDGEGPVGLDAGVYIGNYRG